MKVYIAGPMTGLPHHNYPAFFDAASKLALLGFQPLNPGNTGVDERLRHSDYIRLGIRMLMEADGVALLEGWEESLGAKLEREVALACGMHVAELHDWLADPVLHKLKTSSQW